MKIKISSLSPFSSSRESAVEDGGCVTRTVARGGGVALRWRFKHCRHHVASEANRRPAIRIAEAQRPRNWTFEQVSHLPNITRWFVVLRL